ncbi:HNH endonuclease [Rummeliibacillus sp. TYF005]|uniref:HNH endonuclease n=1 Tax=Rummeliibacillus sp. TYF005 TaxID=2058214 RepID=UPI000F5396D8|nr:HNH endonuclease [Rummeliibacillus sp. TYF005]
MAIVCPPAGLAAGVIYTTIDAVGAVKGEDLISGRKLSDEERLTRGAFAIVPGAGGLATKSLLKHRPALGTVMKTAITKTQQKVSTIAVNSVKSVQKSVEPIINEAKQRAAIKAASSKSAFSTKVENAIKLGKTHVDQLKFAVAHPILSTVTSKAGQKSIRGTASIIDNVKRPVYIKSMEVIGGPKIPVGIERGPSEDVFKNKAEDLIYRMQVKKDAIKKETKGTGKDRQINYTRGFDVEPKYSSYEQRVKTTPVNKGEWSSERAESLFISDKTGEVKKYLDEAGVDGVEYKSGMPDFPPFSKGEIKLENMTNDRKSNFSTADEELAKKWSTPDKKWTADDVADWREDNKYTWHELNDLETIQLVPSKINSVFKHLGGVGEYNIKVKLGE